MDDMQQLKEVLEEMLGEKLYQVIMSNSRDRERVIKVKIRPIMIKGVLAYQETAYRGTQVFHGNYGKEETMQRILEYMSQDFRQCEIETMGGRAIALVSKKGSVTVKRKNYPDRMKEGESSRADLSHNRVKK